MNDLVPKKRKSFLYYLFRDDKEKSGLSPGRAEALRELILNLIKNYFEN